MSDKPNWNKYHYKRASLLGDDNLSTSDIYNIVSSLANAFGGDKIMNKAAMKLYKNDIGSFAQILPMLMPQSATLPAGGFMGLPENSSIQIGELPTRAMEGNPKGIKVKIPW